MPEEALAKFQKCEICKLDLGNIDYDSPLYCKKCISEMEKRSMTPKSYIQYRELKETIKK